MNNLNSQNQSEPNPNMQQPQEKKQGCLFLGIVICFVIIFLLLFSAAVTSCIVSFRNSYQALDKTKKTVVSNNINTGNSTDGITEATDLTVATPAITAAVTPEITSAVALEIAPAMASGEEEDYLTEDEIQSLYSDPEKYKGRHIRISGVVSSFPETDGIGVYFQISQSAASYEKLTYVEYYGEQDVKRGDYIVVDGEVYDKYEGINLSGSINLPSIISDRIEISTYQEALSPTEKEIGVNEAQKQYGYEIKIEKIEFSPIETRVYITINNDGNSKFYAYPFNMRILQGRSQYEYQNNLEAAYPKLQTELLPGASTIGVVCFPAISQTDDFKIYIEGKSQNWKEEIEEYIFDIKVK